MVDLKYTDDGEQRVTMGPSENEVLAVFTNEVYRYLKHAVLNGLTCDLAPDRPPETSNTIKLHGTSGEMAGKTFTLTLTR